MKFQNLIDKKIFLIEIGKWDLAISIDESFTPTETMIEEFVKRRSELMNRLRDFKKSQAAKQNWRENKHKMKSAIKRFHKSTEGKKFHRNLGNFIATREFRTPLDKLSSASEDFSVKLLNSSETLKAISSLKTHLFIESEYYSPLTLQLEFENLLLESVPILSSIEHLVLLQNKLTEDMCDTLITLIDPQSLIQSISETVGLPVEVISSEISSLCSKTNQDKHILGTWIFPLLKDRVIINKAKN